MKLNKLKGSINMKNKFLKILGLVLSFGLTISNCPCILAGSGVSKILKKEDRWERGNKRKIARNVIILVVTGILLFVVGNLLGNTLENLCLRFGIPQLIIGIILGFVTSIPELITFFESQKHHAKAQNDMLGVVEATNNLLTSNMMNLFVIQSIGVIIFAIFHG